MGDGEYDRARAERLGRLLAGIGVETAIAVEENDPQLEAARTIVGVLGASGVAYTVANALVSYRLTARGEDYWLEYARYVSRNPPRATSIAQYVAAFLERSRGNRALLAQKRKRLFRVARVLEEIASSPERFRDLGFLLGALSKALGGRGEEKTIVFAAKMAYYAYRALGWRVEGVERVPLPVDRRIAFLTASSKLVPVPCPEKIMGVYRGAALRAWRVVSMVSGIPLLHLDALLWLPLRGVERIVVEEGLERARRVYASSLARLSGGLVGEGLTARVAEALLAVRPTC